MPKILIASPLEEDIFKEFEKVWTSRGYQLVYQPKLSQENFSQELSTGGYDSCVIGLRDISADTLLAWKKNRPESSLCLIRAGSEPSHIAYDAAAALGIAVMNTPGASQGPVTDYVNKRIPENGLGKTFAVIGFGAIGSKIAEQALAKGYNVQVYSPHFTPEDALTLGITACSSPEEALMGANVVSITAHLVTEEKAQKVNSLANHQVLIVSEKMIGAEALAVLAKDAQIINPSRPWVIDIPALEKAIDDGKVARVDFNTGPGDRDKLKAQYEKLMKSGKAFVDTASDFMTPQAKRITAVQALTRAVDFFENGRVQTPIFYESLWQGTPASIPSNDNTLAVATRRLSHIQSTLQPVATSSSTEPAPSAMKETVVFVGAGIESLVSVKEFVERKKAQGTLDNYRIVVVEKEAEAACGTTFCNGGNFTNIEGLTGLKLGSTSLTRLHKSLDPEKKSDGWLTVPRDLHYMTKAQLDWCSLSDKLARKEKEHVYHSAAQTITNLGKYSVEEAKRFFEKFPELKSAAHFQYLDGENEWLIRVHDKPERKEANYKYFDSLGTNVKSLSFEEMCAQQPGLKGLEDPNFAAQKSTFVTAGGVGMKGGCINARAFTRALAATLAKDDGVVFHYNTKANAIQTNAKGQVVGVETSNKGFIHADKLVISSGVNTDLFKSIGSDVPVQPVAGCTLTVPIGKDVKHFPLKPFKMVTDDGVIVFSPHVPAGSNRPVELRIGGMYWYDPHMNTDVRSPQAQYGLSMLKHYFAQVFPEAYAYASKEKCFNEWIGFRPYTPDNVPIIDQLEYVHGKACKDTGIWINMGHGPGGSSYSFASAKYLLDKMEGKDIQIPGVKPADLSVKRFAYYRHMHTSLTFGEFKEQQQQTWASKSSSQGQESAIRANL